MLCTHLLIPKVKPFSSAILSCQRSWYWTPFKEKRGNDSTRTAHQCFSGSFALAACCCPLDCFTLMLSDHLMIVR